MFESLFHFTARFLVFLGKNLARLALVVLYIGSGGLGWIFDSLHSVSFDACVRMGIFQPLEKPTSEAEPDFERKFSDQELESMAREVGGQPVTIKEIQDMLGLSYRQARKVKQVADSALPVFQGDGKMVAA